MVFAVWCMLVTDQVLDLDIRNLIWCQVTNMAAALYKQLYFCSVSAEMATTYLSDFRIQYYSPSDGKNRLLLICELH
jgi:hypothetical protein